MEYKTRKLVNFTVAIEVVDDFNKHCERLSINKSRLIEKLMKRWLEEHAEKK